jgi:hypothetical protein
MRWLPLRQGWPQPVTRSERRRPGEELAFDLKNGSDRRSRPNNSTQSRAFNWLRSA